MVKSLLRFARSALVFLGLASLLLWAMGRAAMAQGGYPQMAQAVVVEPMPGWRAAAGRHVAGLRLKLAPGWRTYWRSAGSAGIAPRMDWTGSRGVAGVEPAWPTPHTFRQGSDLSIGYAADFVLPLVVSVSGPAPELRGRLDLGVCADICLPVRIDLRLALPDPGRRDPEILRALADRPARLPVRADCATRPTPDGLALTGAAFLPALDGPEVVVFEVDDPRLWVTDATVARDGDRITATSELMIGGGQAVSLDPASVRITVIGADSAVELAGCAE